MVEKQQIAEVLVNVAARSLDKTFSYLIPDTLQRVERGWRVVVPFGHRQVEGFVLAVRAATDNEVELKPIADVVTEGAWFNEHMLAVARWMSNYYLCPLAEALRLFIPGKSGVKQVVAYEATEMLERTDLTGLAAGERAVLLYVSQQGRVTADRLTAVYGKESSLLAEKLVETGWLKKSQTAAKKDRHIYKKRLCLQTEWLAQQDVRALLQRKPAQLRLVEALQQEGTLAYEQLAARGFSQAAARALVNAGVAVLEEYVALRDSYAEVEPVTLPLTLAPQQQTAFAAVQAALQEQRFQSFLLHGITGSGKTQVYIEAVATARQQGRQAIVMVPEIALTGQIVARFKARFGRDVVVLHSKLSAGERYDVWQRLHQQEAGIVIGARSAIFAPLNDIGIIIMDEEHEFTYKQEEKPRYHARQVALERARLSHAVVILGSATPAIETYYAAEQGQHQLLTMQERIDGAALPPIAVVDMRAELKLGRRSVLSHALQQLLKETLERQEQAIILLNRRGYATFVMCRECGHIVECPHCDVSLVYHQTDRKLRCHYCQMTQATPAVCPACHSRYIRFFGTGTQKVEEELAELFPAARVVRMDQDTTSGKHDHSRILTAFAKGKYDILLGTQMVAKGHDVHNVTAVGVVAADSVLNIPDFRSAERVFSLVTQAAGRAGRGNKAGQVVVQTYNPEHYAVASGAKHDYQAFYEAEAVCRKGLGYPPYGQMLKLTVSAKQEISAQQQAGEIAAKLKAANLGLSILGPFAAAIAKVNDVYRVQILLKGKDLTAAKAYLVELGLTAQDTVTIDVDPLNSM